MKTAIAVILALSLGGCTGFVDGLDGFYHSRLPNEDATRLLEELLPSDEWKHIYPDSNPQQDASAILFDYGEEGGKLLSLQRSLDPQSLSSITVGIQDAAGIRLRHQIIVEADLDSWELLRKETTWPEDNPFKRIYLFKLPEAHGHQIRGLIFLDSVKAEVSYPGPFTDETIDEVESLTWRVSERLEEIYERELRAISEDPMFVRTQPLLLRPDLPDPDTSDTHNMEKSTTSPTSHR